MESIVQQQTVMQSPTGQDKCSHYWIIDSSEGVISHGKCNLCGMKKEFINDWETVIALRGKDNSDY